MIKIELPHFFKELVLICYLPIVKLILIQSLIQPEIGYLYLAS